MQMHTSRESGRTDLLVRFLFIAEVGRPRALLGRDVTTIHGRDKGRQKQESQ